MDNSGFNKFRSKIFNKHNTATANDFLKKNVEDFSDKALFTIFRDDSSYSEKKDITEKYLSNKQRDFTYGAFGNLFPKTSMDILKFPIPKKKAKNLKKIIETYLFTFAIYEKELIAFLEAKKKYEYYLEKANYEECFTILETFSKKYGFSVWLLDSYKKIQNEISDQLIWKDILKDFYEGKGFLRGQIISYIENRGGGVEFLSFVSQLKERSHQNEVRNNVRNANNSSYSLLKILTLLPHDGLKNENFIEGLWVGESLSLVDRYLLMIKLIDYLALKKRSEMCLIDKEHLLDLMSPELRNMFLFFTAGIVPNSNKLTSEELSLAFFSEGANDFFSRTYKSYIENILKESTQEDNLLPMLYLFYDFEKCKKFVQYFYCSEGLVSNKDFLSQISESDLNHAINSLNGGDDTKITIVEILKDCIDSENSIDEKIKVIEMLANDKTLNLITIFFIRKNIIELRRQARYLELVILLKYLLINKPGILKFLQVDEIVTEIEQMDYCEAHGEVGIVLLVNYIERANVKGVDYERIYRRLDSFLFSNGLSLPSQLIESGVEFPEDIGKIFYGEICVPSVIDSLSALEIPEEVLLERYKVLDYLVLLSNESIPSYSSEMHNIVKDVILTQSLEEISAGKININKAQIENVVERQIKKYLDAYNSISPDIEFVSMIKESYDNIVLEALEDDISVLNFEDLPVRAVFHENLFKGIRESYLNDPYFGLDNCLSVRVRHTVIKSFMKGIFSKHHLLSSGGEEDLLLDYAFWKTYYENENIKIDMDKVMSKFESFRSSINEYVEFLKQKVLHIQTGNNSYGIFVFAYDRGDTLRLNRELSSSGEEVTSKKLLASTFDFLDSQMKVELSKVREYFCKDVADKIKDHLLEFESEIKTLDVDNAITSAIGRCRSEIDSSMEELSRWFELENEEKFSDFYIEDLLELYKISYERLVPGLNLDIRIEYEGNKVLMRGKHKTKIIDIYNNIISNIIKRSGQYIHNCQFSILFKYSPEEVNIVVTNPCNLSELHSIEEKVKKSKEDLKNLTKNPSLINRERGGTGLLKIHNILKNHLSLNSNLMFDFKDSVFTTQITLCGFGLFRSVK